MKKNYYIYRVYDICCNWWYPKPISHQKMDFKPYAICLKFTIPPISNLVVFGGILAYNYHKILSKNYNTKLDIMYTFMVYIHISITKDLHKKLACDTVSTRGKGTNPLHIKPSKQNHG